MVLWWLGQHHSCGSVHAHLTLSTSKKTFELKQDRLHVVKVDGRFYVQTGWRKRESDPQRLDIYRIDSAGFVRVCSFVDGPDKSLERTGGG